jgi:fructokinase
MNEPLRIAAVGEVLWDVFPDGPRFGGAPANFACHTAALGAQSSIVSCVGDDALGRDATSFLQQHAVDVTHLQTSSNYPTGTVQVQLDAEGSPQFEISRQVAWDFVDWSESLASLASGLQAICFGSLGQRSELSRQTIQRLVAATPADCLRVLDINLRPPFIQESILRESLQLANVLKLNEDELRTVSALTGAGGSDLKQLSEIRQAWDLQLIAVTRGSRGSVLFTASATSEIEGQKVSVADTVGAGDSFNAAMVVGLLQGDPLDALHLRAAQIAAYVCTQAGAVPTLPSNLQMNKPRSR